MATATIDHHHHLHFDSLQLIDLRLLSQSELLSLSLCSCRASTSAASLNDDEDEVSTPKIDRSVFNESAGSRKQTFSRLRLAPRNSSQISPQIPSTAGPVEPLDGENSEIICLLKSLLNIQSHLFNTTIDNNEQLIPVRIEYSEYWNANANAHANGNEEGHDVPIGIVTCSARKRKRGRPRKDEIRSDNWWVIESEHKANEIKSESNNIKVNEVNEVSEGLVNIQANVVACETGKRKRGRPRKNENINEIKVTVVSDSSANVVTGERRKRGRGRPRKDERKNGNKYFNVLHSGNKTKKEIVAGENKEELAKEELAKDVVTENRDGVVVDLVALADMEDPFGEELKRRTEGIEKREELLDFLTRLKGVWVSIRKKRKIVDASEFGNALPSGWKLMLCIKKKVGHVWLGCRRYISPNGRQFVSCKEISSYLLSLSGRKDGSKPSVGHTGDCIQLVDKMTSGNASDPTLGEDKNGVDLVFHSPFPTISISTEHEKQGTLLKIKSPGEVERRENCSEQYSVSNITNQKLENKNAATEVSAAKLSVHLVAETMLYNNLSNNFCEPSGERDVLKRTINSSNNLSTQVQSSLNWSTFSGSGQPCVVENNVNGGYINSVEEQKQAICYGSGFLSLNAKEKTFSCQNLEKRRSTSSMEHVKVNVDKDARYEAISGSGDGCTGLEDTVTYVKDRGNFEGCSTVLSGSELRCGSVNDRNRVSTSTLSEATQQKSSESGLHSSSGNDHTCIFNSNLNSISTNMLHEPKFDDVDKSRNNDLTIGFGNTHSVNKHRCSEDTEGGLLDLFGSENSFGFDNNLTQVSPETMVDPKLHEVRDSGEQACATKNNYTVGTNTVQASRLEDLGNARNNELMTALSNHRQSGVDVMAEFLWRTDGEKSLLSGLIDTSSRLLQSSGCFPAFEPMTDKGESDVFSEKYDTISGFDGLRLGSMEHMEYDFLTTQSSSHSTVSKALPYEAEMLQGFDSSIWLEKEALPLLPRLGSSYQITTMCAWCRNEFRHEPVDTRAETGSVGFMCPTCKAKFSGSHNSM